MQLDRTRVAIRERGTLEICDLALHVMRAFSPALLVMLAVGIVPVMLINRLALGWMTEDLVPWTFVRYVWVMSLLVFIQAPLATSVATVYLGDAMFLEKPTLRAVLKNLSKLSGRIFVCQGLLRGVLPAWLLAATLSPFETTPGDVLLPLLAMALFLLRALRPYVSEIVLLERNPLRSRDQRAITIGRRSAKLHNPNSGDLLARYLAIALLTVLLVIVVLFGIWFIAGTVLGDWRWGPVMLHVVLPGAMWLVAGYMAVVRYLAYLDLRIRREGWAVELQLRAEANRLQRQAF